MSTLGVRLLGRLVLVVGLKMLGYVYHHRARCRTRSACYRSSSKNLHRDRYLDFPTSQVSTAVSSLDAIVGRVAVRRLDESGRANLTSQKKAAPEWQAMQWPRCIDDT